MQTIFDESLMFSFREVVEDREVVEESILEILNGNGLAGFQESLRDGMNSLSATIQQRLIELIDSELVSDCSRRKDWVIERKNDAKTILSPFGPVTYRRTYFRNKRTGKYTYLADRALGYTPHQRLDTLLEADLLEEVADSSYRKAGESQEKRAQGTSVSGQTVLNLVRKLQPEQIELKEKPSFKKERKKVASYILKPMRTMSRIKKRVFEGLSKSWSVFMKVVFAWGQTATSCLGRSTSPLVQE